MKRIIPSNRFQRDYKRAIKRGLSIEKLECIVDMLSNEMPLPTRCRPHKLTGNWLGYWECHIEPDWLLIYDFDNETVDLAATGTHADLFK